MPRDNKPVHYEAQLCELYADHLLSRQLRNH